MSKATMQSWADHCSSSEDEAEEYPNNNDNSKDIAEEEDATKLQGIAEETNNTQNDFFDSYNNNNTNEQTLPTSPPFRAFIRNLIPGLVDKDIAQELEELTNYAIKCSNLKIMRPKAQQQQYSNQPPPYCNGYVDVETVEQLKILLDMDNQVELKCNDNRRLKVEVARSSSQYQQQPRFSSGSNNLRSGKSEDRGGSNASFPIDGRQFRGGMYNNNNRIATNNRRSNNNEKPFYNNKEGADNIRTNRSSSDRNLTTDPSQQQPQEEKRQRPTLKLLPRTKPLEEKNDKVESSTPSDASKQPSEAWQTSKREVIPEPTAVASTNKDSSNNLDTITGPGETTSLVAVPSKKGENLNARGKQQQRNRSSGEQPRKKTGKSEPIKKKQQQQRGKTSSEIGTWEEPKKVLPTASLVPPKASAPAQSVVKVTNAFAALGDSDSDE
mmetsp:Transcript_6854/g.9985  ORF Transcript_6854/g.9985 Transcript_6854/m.9985 type:complete len:439 (+) Transcript_6854:327-1643(+)|eukprot:CAMPEP_0172428990 /NCGR_PEP_ID=MMETSP1064-20121228/48532_1 /TAXON_ID=202472 /ORGANISM="Aulacoseira subarctica , Strain CCAP 1002/5" /LENGTH=438 /DNA_ID=CAMNT_0013174085 /DNA_START=251 /DNA_END=1567 /DNA_ORIENTATION=-